MFQYYRLYSYCLGVKYSLKHNCKLKTTFYLSALSLHTTTRAQKTQSLCCSALHYLLLSLLPLCKYIQKVTTHT